MHQQQPPSDPSQVEPAARHRSGAVARMLRMPVATLRVWERRYGVTQPVLSASGQRLYSADDVRRLALLKQLTDLGHAIGSLARLNMQQLQQVASTHADALMSQANRGAQAASAGHAAAAPAQGPLPPAPPWRVLVIGAALAGRLQSPALLRRLTRPVQFLGPYADAAQANAALQGAPIDTLLVREPRLQPDWLAALQATAPALAALPKAVLYRFAAESSFDDLAANGTALLREPQSDTVLGQWLQSVLIAAEQAAQRCPQSTLPSERFAAREDAGAGTQPYPPLPPRRWSDAALADFAGLSSTIACECPRHVAELLVQLSQFEAYSAECCSRSGKDAELHAYLGRVAGLSRARFESALEYVALHEGLVLPS